MNTKLMFSSKEEKWQTPQYLFDELDKEFNFTLDPCCQHDSAKCKKYYTPEEDGLKQSWEGETVFVNPPYGRELKKWVKKCWEESHHAKVVMLIPSRTDTTYFHDYIYGEAEIRFLKGRIKFIHPETKQPGDAAPFGSMIVVFNHKNINYKNIGLAISWAAEEEVDFIKVGDVKTHMSEDELNFIVSVYNQIFKDKEQ